MIEIWVMRKQIFIFLALIGLLVACTPAAPTAQPAASLSPATSLMSTRSPSPTYTPLASPNPTQTPAPAPALTGEVVGLPSPDGSWTAILSRQAGSLELEDPQGVKHAVFPAGSMVNDAQWSPDGKRLAVALNNLPPDWQYGDEAKIPPEIHFVDFDDGAFTKAESFYQADSETPGGRIILGAWSPDDLRILFWLGSMSGSLRADGFPLWVLDINSVQAASLAEATLVNPAYESWAPDGRALVFTDGGFRSAQVNNKWVSKSVVRRVPDRLRRDERLHHRGCY